MTVGRLLLQAIGLLTVLVLPHFLAPRDFGKLATILAALSMGGALVELGLGWFEMRFLAPAWRRGDTDAALRIGSTIVILRLFIGALVAALLALYFTAQPEFELGAVAGIALGIWIFCRLAITTAALTQLPLGNRRSYIGLEVLRTTSYLVAVPVGYVMGGLPGSFILLAVIMLLCLTYAAVGLYPGFPIRLSLFTAGPLWRYRAYIGWTAVSAILASAQLWAPLSVVGVSGELEQAASLGIAVQILGMSHMLTTGMRQGLMPLISSALADQDMQRAASWMSLLARLVTAFSVLGLLIWLAIGGMLVGILWPQDYAGLAPLLALVIIAFALLNLAACNDTLLNLLGHAALSARNLLLSTVLILAVTGWAIGQSEVGLALAVCVAYVAGALVLALTSYWSLYRRHGIGFNPVLAAAMLLSAGVLGHLCTRSPGISPVYILLLLLLYLMALVLCGFLKRQEIEQMWAALRSA
jgi:O-antigen/teichoic acid export membrane protein